MLRNKSVLFAVMLIAMFAVGATVAWVQDVQNTKVLLGQVVDEQNRQPIAGAMVRVASSAQDARATQTDESGNYRIPIGSAPVTVTVQARGYQPTTGPFTPDDPLIKDFRLDVVVRPYILSGTVKDISTRKPIVYASLSAGDAQAQTGEDGRFTLARIEPGAKLKIEATGYYPFEAQWTGESALDFTLTAKTIAIAVSNVADGKPLKASVLVNSARYQTDAQGRIVIREPESNAKISASADDFATAETTYTGQAVVELLLKPSSFKAVVKNARTGKPIAGATIYVNGVAALSTSDEGKFGLSDIAPGTPLRIKAAGYALCEGKVPATPSMDIALTPFVARGVYLPFGLLGNESKVRALIDMIDRTELNALVVDVKGDRGRVSLHSDNPLIKAMGTELVQMDLRELLRIAHEKKIYVIARIVTFKDDPLTKVHPEWAVHTKSGAVWKDGEQLGWANPYLRQVWDYNLAIAKEAAALGFDEVQFDYIRFPSDGNVNDIYFPPPHTPETRAAALRDFLNEVNKAFKPYPVFISADVFGMTVWTHDDMGIGQRLEEIAQRVDYVQPMVYPSTFTSGNLGYANPSKFPYEVIFRSMKAAAERVSTPLRPWLQAYSSRDVAYGIKEFLAQKRAANDAGTAGWVFWNSAGEYNPSIFGQ